MTASSNEFSMEEHFPEDRADAEGDMRNTGRGGYNVSVRHGQMDSFGVYPVSQIEHVARTLHSLPEPQGIDEHVETEAEPPTAAGQESNTSDSNQPEGISNTNNANVVQSSESSQPEGISSTNNANVVQSSESNQPEGNISNTNDANVVQSSESSQPEGISSTNNANVVQSSESNQPEGNISNTNDANVVQSSESSQPSGETGESATGGEISDTRECKPSVIIEEEHKKYDLRITSPTSGVVIVDLALSLDTPTITMPDLRSMDEAEKLKTLQKFSVDLDEMAPTLGEMNLTASVLQSDPNEFSVTKNCLSTANSTRTSAFLCWVYNDIQWKSLYSGLSMAAKQWGRKKDQVEVLFPLRSVILLLYLAIFGYQCYHLHDTIVRATSERYYGGVLYATVALPFSIVGLLVSLARWIYFIIRRRRELLLLLKKGCLFLVDKEKVNCRQSCCDCCIKLSDCCQNCYHSCTCSCKTDWESNVLCLRSCRYRFLSNFGNFSDTAATVIDEIMGIVLFLTTLYTFMGYERFRMFHGVVRADDVASFVVGLLFPCLLLLLAHGTRVYNIIRNVLELRSDILAVPVKEQKEQPNSVPKEEQKRRPCLFQYSIIVHTVSMTLLQLWLVVVLAWKIIRDHCLSFEEAQRLRLTPVVNETASPTPSLSNCHLYPDAFNFYTVLNIIYTVLVLPAGGYLLLFVSNMPLVVEYAQHLHVSGLYKVQKLLELGVYDGDDGQVCGYHNYRRIFMTLFYNVLGCNVTKSDLETRIKAISDLRRKVEEDLKGGMYNLGSRKFSAIILSVPTMLLALPHFLLFFVNIVFLSCRYSPVSSGVFCASSDSLSVYTNTLAGDEAVLIIFLLLLFSFTSFPGPPLALVVIIILIIVLGIVATIVLVVLAVFVIACLASGSSSSNNTR